MLQFNTCEHSTQMDSYVPSLYESLVTRAVINGAMYALCCDADFYLFVE